MRPTINSKKHFVQVSLANIAAGTITKLSIADAVPVSGITGADEVREGASIKACYVEMWVTSDDVTQSSGILTLEKKPAQTPAMTAAQSGSLDTYPNKKNILTTHMGLFSPKTGSNPIPVFRGWYKIPKGKQRFGFDDQLILNVHAQSDGLNICGFFVYKEYY